MTLTIKCGILRRRQIGQSP